MAIFVAPRRCLLAIAVAPAFAISGVFCPFQSLAQLIHEIDDGGFLFATCGNNRAALGLGLNQLLEFGSVFILVLGQVEFVGGRGFNQVLRQSPLLRRHLGMRDIFYKRLGFLDLVGVIED